MLRRALIVVPLLGAVVALAADRLPARPVSAALLGAAAGLFVALWLGRIEERRIVRLAARVERFANDGEQLPEPDDGSSAWRRLTRALADVGVSVQNRYRTVALERERIEQLLESLPTAILLFADEGMTYANPAGRQLFAVGRSEERTPLQVLGVEGLANAVAEARETGRDVDVEVRRDDRELGARATVTAEGVVGLIVSDLTDARRLEAVRRDFVTNASHELKTPVAGMQALADSIALAVNRHPDRARTMIARMQHEAARLAQLVRDLLDLARLEEDAAAASQRRRVDLAEVVRTQAERLRGLASERHVTLRVDDEGPAPLVAQPGDLRLIVANLLENAVQYNRSGGKVDVSVRRSGGEVILEVADDGIGISEADRDRVFERFYRVDKGRSRAAGGTGLGLAIVRHATERHGGDVTLRSVLGEGSVFRVVLPVEGSAPDRP